MELVSVLIALGAVAVAVLGYVLNRSAIRGEAADRRRQLELLERSIAVQTAEHEATGQAVVRAEPGSISWGEPSSRYTVVFVNGGPAAARDVQYRVIRETGAEVARGDVAAIMMAGDREKRGISITRDDYDELVVMVKWLDRGGHEEPACRLQTRP